MPDYKFEALGTRSFEQLTQALAVAVISPGVTPFGDGRDGGREATFEGFTTYDTGAGPWDGSGVIQSKFLQRPLGTVHDGDWALKQLRSELRQYTKKTSKRESPDYYIFVTNATLSSVQDIGTKDRVFATLQKFADQTSLKGFDVWDYDKLRTLLDIHPDIRTSYDAWITTGDVLRLVVERLAEPSPDFTALATRLLAREILDNQFARLEQAGHASDAAVPLASVFFDSRYSPSPVELERDDDEPEGDSPDQGNEKVVEQLLHSAQLKLDSHSRAKFDHEKKAGRYVIIGGPGQGKTTLAQFTCQLFRAALLETVAPQLLTPDVRRVLRDLADQRESQGLSLPGARRFPIHVVLNEFAQWIARRKSKEPRRLVDFIASRMSRRLKEAIQTSDLEKLLRAYPAVVVLDGLDEVPASSNRRQVLESISEFLLDAQLADADYLVIATSRPQGYSDDFNPQEFRHMYLKPLLRDEAVAYGSRLIESRYETGSDRSDSLIRKLDAACEEETVRHLMRSPLQVTIMTLLVDRSGQPPQERYSLFHEYYELIYRRELERGIPAASVLREYKADIDIIHWRVGLILQARSEAMGGTEARLTLAEFSAIVRGRLEEEGHDGPHLEALLASIVDSAGSRLVFLVGHESDAIGFEIRSLQEFMAAEAIHDGSDIQVQARLRQIAPIAHWRNVFLFAAGRCFAKDQSLRDTIVLLCRELNDENDTDRASAALLTGSRLAIDLLEDGSCRRQPKYALTLAGVSAKLLRYDSAPMLARLVSAFVDLGLTDVLVREIREQEQSSVDSRVRVAILLRRHGDDRGRELLGSWFESLTYRQSAVVLGMQLATPEVVVEALNDETVAELPDLRFARMRNPDFMSSMSESLPDWLFAAFGALGGFPIATGIGVKVTAGGGAPSRFGVRHNGVLARFREMYDSLASVPFDHGTWAWMRGVGAFLRDPNPSSLLASVDSAWETGNSKAHLLRTRLCPWVVSSLAGYVLDPAARDAVVAGEIGGLGEWEQAEERWRRKGITIGDVRHTLMRAESLPFGIDIAEVGFPWSDRTSFSFFSSDDDSVQVEEFLQILKESPASPARTAFLFSVTSLVGRMVVTSASSVRGTSAILAKLLTEGSNSERRNSLPLEALDRLVRDDDLGGVGALLDQNFWVYGGMSAELGDPEGLARVLREKMDAGSESFAIYSAATALGEVWSGAAKSFEGARSPGPVLFERDDHIGVLFNLLSRAFGMAAIEAVGADFSRFGPYLADQIDTVLEVQMMDALERQRVLTELALAPGQDESFKLMALERVAELRESGLAVSDTCRELGLPAAVAEACET